MSWGASGGVGGEASAIEGAAKPAEEAAATLDPSPSVQPAGNEKLRFYFMPIRGLPLAYQIDSVQPDGSVRGSIRIPERQAAQLARMGLSVGIFSNLTEGYLFGLTGLPESDYIEQTILDISQNSLEFEGVSAIRVQVIGVQEGGKATFRVGPQAVSTLKTGDTLVLMRPPGSSTAQLQAMPDIVAVTDARGDVLGMDPRLAARLVQSKNNLKQIGLAMHNFHDVHKCFPPAVIYGPDGKPWHSWRVLLLPYLEQASLYEQYKFDEPWDGPNNKRLLVKVPSIYRDPVYGSSEDPYTHYAVAIGKGTAFRPAGYRMDDPRRVYAPRMGTSLRDFRDGSSNSILVGSVSPTRKIPWTKPEDIVFDDDFPGIGKKGGFAAPFKTDNASGGAFVRADGSVTSICADIEMHVLRNLIQIADGQRIPKIPTLEPHLYSRQEQIAVIEIQRTPAGPKAKLVIETVTPQEEFRPGEPPRRKAKRPAKPSPQTT